MNGTTCWCRCENEADAFMAASCELLREQDAIVEGIESSCDEGNSEEDEGDCNIAFQKQLETFQALAAETLALQIQLEGGHNE